MLVYPVLLLILTFYGAKISSNEDCAPDFLTKKQSRMIEAAACIGVVIHHVTQDITSYGQRPKGSITVFVYIGFLFTALFFFFSGYGLMTSFSTKPDYLRFFLQRRLPGVLVPFWICNLIGVLVVKPQVAPIYSNMGRPYIPAPDGPLDILKKVFGLTLVNSNGWFIIEIVILYLLFYAFFSLIKNKDLALVFMCIGVAVIIAFSFLQGHDPEGAKAHWFRGEWWYNSTISFAFGLLFACFGERAKTFFKEYLNQLTVVFSILTVVLIYASYFAVNRFSYYHEGLPTYMRDAFITLVIQIAACIVFIVLVLLLNLKITIGNRALGYISSIQLPLFLVHGYFVTSVFKHVAMSDFLRYAAVIASGIICAGIIAPVSRFISNKITAILTWQKKANDTLEAKAAEELRQKRTRRLRRVLAAAIVVLFAALPVAALTSKITRDREYELEREVLGNAAVGDRVLYGRYETDRHKPGKERLTWIVIKKSGDRLCLLSEKGIAGSYYNQRHTEVTWKDSDLRRFLNSDEFTDMFSDKEMSLIVPEQEDLITLLTPDEAQEVFETDSERELAITDMAEFRGVNINVPSKANNWDMKGYRSSWWWLKGSSELPEITAPIVTVDGEISLAEKAVNKPGGAIRPVIWLRVE